MSATISTNPLETSVLLGEANVLQQIPTAEADFPILELPVSVKDAQNAQTTAETDIWVDFTIKSDVNSFDYEILIPSSILIAKGDAEGKIKVQVKSNNRIEGARRYVHQNIRGR